MSADPAQRAHRALRHSPHYTPARDDQQAWRGLLVGDEQPVGLGHNGELHPNEVLITTRGLRMQLDAQWVLISYESLSEIMYPFDKTSDILHLTTRQGQRSRYAFESHKVQEFLAEAVRVSFENPEALRQADPALYTFARSFASQTQYPSLQAQTSS